MVMAGNLCCSLIDIAWCKFVYYKRAEGVMLILMVLRSAGEEHPRAARWLQHGWPVSGESFSSCWSLYNHKPASFSLLWNSIECTIMTSDGWITKQPSNSRTDKDRTLHDNENIIYKHDGLLEVSCVVCFFHFHFCVFDSHFLFGFCSSSHPR